MADKKQEDNKNKTLFNAAQISIDSIFKQMHDIAVEKSKDTAKVQNSIFDESGKFHGAGSHIIAAMPLKDNEDKIESSVALNAIKTYVQWFSGPDIANTINEDDLIEIEDEADNKESNESIKIPSFLQYIKEANDKEANDKEKNDEVQNSKKDDSSNITAKGYYITYKLEIEGQKETPLSDALKTFGKGLLKGLGIQSFDWKAGAKGKEHTVGDLIDTLDQVFGKINPEELRARFTKNAKAKYPQTTANDVYFYDQKTILHHLKGKLESNDIKKIKTADYSLCYRVPANDKSKKLINTTVVADLITRSIKGLFKKFKNVVKKEDVILVNDYNETNKDQKKIDKKLEQANDKNITTDSANINYKSSLINEETSNDNSDDKKLDENFKNMSAELSKLAKSTLGDDFEHANIAMPSEILKDIENEGIVQTDNPDLYSVLNDDKNKNKHVFLIKTKHLKQSDNNQKNNNQINSSLDIHSLMNFIFEANDDKTTEELHNKVINVFKSLYNNFKKILPKNKQDKLQDPKIYSVEVPVKTESIINTDLSKLKIFEDCEITDDIYKLLLVEKTNSQKSQDHITNEQAKQLIQLIKTKTLDGIQQNKDVVNKKWGEPKQGQKDFKWPGKYKDQVDEFSNLVFNQNDEDKVVDYINSAIHNKGDTAKLQKVVLTRFIPAIKDISVEQKKETVKVNFYDADPKTGEKIGDPLNKEPFEIEKGSNLKDNEKINDAIVEYNKQLDEGNHGKGDKEGYIKHGWTPDINNAKAENDIDVVAKYINEEKKDKTFTVMFQYAPDQEKPNNTEIIKVDDKEEQTVKAGDAAKKPDNIPEIEGYEFKDWGEDTEKLENVEEDIVAIAQYEKTIKINPKAPKDPEKPNDDLELIGDPIKYDPKKSLEEQLPDPPEKEGWELDGWDPDPKSVKDPKEDIDIVAKYKKVGEEESENSQVSTYWICIDENGFLDHSKVSVKHTDVDFYIVPMKNLKMDNTDDDDEKEVEGKSSK